MASLILTFSETYIKVSEFLGFGSSPAGTNLTTVKDITHRGYRKFLFPLNLQTNEVYIWSFLRKTGTLITKTGEANYTLPPDFIGLISGFKFDAGEDNTNPIKIDMSKLRSMRSISVATGIPVHYAIGMEQYNAETGTFYEVSFYKPPNAALTYKYGYIFDPPKLSATTDYFIGGVRASEVILDCALAVAELQMDDVAGEKVKRAAQSVASLIEYDKGHSPNAIELDPNLIPSIPRFRITPEQGV